MKKVWSTAVFMFGCTGLAQATTSVTLYGVVDAGLGYERIKQNDVTQKRFGLFDGVQSGNRWGLKGTEDLGGG